VVLLDYQLPDSRDLELLAAVRRLAPKSAIILMSAFLTPEITRQALAGGASQVVAKPIDMRDVRALVHGLPTAR
jgi:DNA-binding NtrC family response regulator